MDLRFDCYLKQRFVELNIAPVPCGITVGGEKIAPNGGGRVIERMANQRVYLALPDVVLAIVLPITQTKVSRRQLARHKKKIPFSYRFEEEALLCSSLFLSMYLPA
jgi:hypothetical protein